MKFRNIRYFLSESLKSMFRNRLMSIASIVTVASCTLIFAISYFIITNINQIMENFERSQYVVVFIDFEATQEEVDVLEEQLRAIPHVTSISFTSSEEAFLRVSADVGLEANLLGIVPDEIFPRSFYIEMDSVENQRDIVEAASELRNAMQLLYDQEGIDALISVSRIVSIISAVIIAFLALISTVIIINTIKITVTARKNEINIMKYVGATDWFIRWPFLMEGVLIGVFGATLALGIGYFVYNYTATLIMEGDTFVTTLLAVFYFEPRATGDVFVVLAPICIAMGITVGMIGSATSVRRHLMV